jgi:predicted RecA/RadA family phage recombinase
MQNGKSNILNGYLHDGKNLVIKAPYEVQKGEGLQIGTLFGIASTWAERDQLVPISLAGVFDVHKPDHERWTVGEKIFWDKQKRSFTQQPVPGAFVGVAVENSNVDQSDLGRLRILGVAV